MTLRVFKPTTAGQRFKTTLDFADITKNVPEKSLLVNLPRISGRSNGKVTSQGRGGRHKRFLRVIDFKRDKRDIPARVVAIEYDPNRSANIALLHYHDGEKRYILAPNGLKVGHEVVAGENADIKPGNALPLSRIPIGTVVHNVELTPGTGAQITRSAGTGAILAAKEGKWIHIKLPSKEVRKINASAYASIGQVGNVDWKNTTLGKAGRSRHLGIKPHVRGVAMDPASHPHGGGEGKSGTGMHPKTPTGKKAMGAKTRKRKKPSNKFILTRRK